MAGFGLDAVVLRFFSLYGPGLRKQLFWDLARRVQAGERRLELSGRGDEARDFLFVDDAVALIGLAAAMPPSTALRTLNAGRGEGISVRTAAETLVRALGSEVAVGFTGETRPGDPASLVADISEARRLGFAPRIGFEAGIGRLAAWIRTPAAQGLA